jgi:3-oxoacyl-[acyl-carrier protein] reductase
MDLRGKIVLVTGASSGIGKAIAIAFAHKGAHALVHYGRNKVGAQETLRDVEKVSSGRVYQADLMDLAATKSLFGEIKRTTPTIRCADQQCRRIAPGGAK